MEQSFVLQGRVIGDAELGQVRHLLRSHAEWSRYRLSRELCSLWKWLAPNGQMQDMAARSLLLKLEQRGLLVLPPKRCASPNRMLHKKLRPVDHGQEPISEALASLMPLEVAELSQRPGDLALYEWLLHQHHYLGYTQPVGEHLKYVYYSRGTPMACMAWSSSPRHLGARDRFIGWTAEQRRAHIHLLAYNTRFLILPWARIPCLASHLLGRTARRISEDWQKLYHHPVCLLETFIDPERFRGSCYRAANWIFVGRTIGRGKNDQTKRANRSLKELWVYPLGAFRQALCHG